MDRVQAQVEELPENRVRLTVQVPSHDVHHAVEHAADDLAQSVKVPGFRKGRVPRQVLLQRVGRVLDGVVHVVRRNLDCEPDAVLRQLLDLGLHAVHSSRERTGEVERSRHVSPWILSLVGLSGAIWLAIFSAMLYAVRVRA